MTGRGALAVGAAERACQSVRRLLLLAASRSQAEPKEAPDILAADDLPDGWSEVEPALRTWLRIQVGPSGRGAERDEHRLGEVLRAPPFSAPGEDEQAWRVVADGRGRLEEPLVGRGRYGLEGATPLDRGIPDARAPGGEVVGESRDPGRGRWQEQRASLREPVLAARGRARQAPDVGSDPGRPGPHDLVRAQLREPPNDHPVPAPPGTDPGVAGRLPTARVSRPLGGPHHRFGSASRSRGLSALAAATARSERVDAAYRVSISRLFQPAWAMRSDSCMPAASIEWA